MNERGMLTKATQDELIKLLTEFLEAKEVKGAKLIAVASNVILRIADDSFADKLDDEELKAKSRILLEKLIVNHDVDVALLVDFILEIVALFKK